MIYIWVMIKVLGKVSVYSEGENNSVMPNFKFIALLMAHVQIIE